MEAECISCGSVFDIGDKPKLGQIVICPTCNAHLEVTWLDPIELGWSIDEDDITDDEYEEDEDYEP